MSAESEAEWRKGYKAGKESGLMESTHGGEIAVLRARLATAEQNACPDHRVHGHELASSRLRRTK